MESGRTNQASMQQRALPLNQSVKGNKSGRKIKSSLEMYNSENQRRASNQDGSKGRTIELNNVQVVKPTVAGAPLPIAEQSSKLPLKNQKVLKSQPKQTVPNFTPQMSTSFNGVVGGGASAPNNTIAEPTMQNHSFRRGQLKAGSQTRQPELETGAATKSTPDQSKQFNFQLLHNVGQGSNEQQPGGGVGNAFFMPPKQQKSSFRALNQNNQKRQQASFKSNQMLPLQGGTVSNSNSNQSMPTKQSKVQSGLHLAHSTYLQNMQSQYKSNQQITGAAKSNNNNNSSGILMNGPSIPTINDYVSKPMQPGQQPLHKRDYSQDAGMKAGRSGGHQPGSQIPLIQTGGKFGHHKPSHSLHNLPKDRQNLVVSEKNKGLNQAFAGLQQDIVPKSTVQVGNMLSSIRKNDKSAAASKSLQIQQQNFGKNFQQQPQQQQVSGNAQTNVMNRRARQQKNFQNQVNGKGGPIPANQALNQNQMTLDAGAASQNFIRPTTSGDGNSIDKYKRAVNQNLINPSSRERNSHSNPRPGRSGQNTRPISSSNRTIPGTRTKESSSAEPNPALKNSNLKNGVIFHPQNQGEPASQESVNTSAAIHGYQGGQGGQGGQQKRPISRGMRLEQQSHTETRKISPKVQLQKQLRSPNNKRDKSANSDYQVSAPSIGLNGVGRGSPKSKLIAKHSRASSEPHNSGAGPPPTVASLQKRENDENNSAQSSKKEKKIVNIITKFSFATKGGISSHNPYKVNQDAYITNPHIMGLKHCHFFSVCDGHGSNGRDVSSFLKHRLPMFIENQLQIKLENHDLGTYPPLSKVHPAMINGFQQANNEVCNMGTDVRYSGSTCVSLLTYGRHLFIANVGDSRAIIIKQDPDDSKRCIARPLTRDHKPDDPQEAPVILAAGGRIDSYRDSHGNKVGPERVWLKNEDIPGLAMSRSFGDQVASRVGVNAVPEISELRMTCADKVIILASDGVWEFLENQQVADIVYPYFLQRNAEGAAENLVRAAFKTWKREENVIDDITCIVIFLDIRDK